MPALAGVSKGPLHLWFLWYVLLFYAVAVAVGRLPRPEPLRSSLVAVLESPFAAPVLAGTTTALLVAADMLLSPPELWIVPNPGLVVFYGAFFAVGLLVHGSSGGIAALGRRPALNGALALAALVPTVLLRDGPIWLGPGAHASSPRAYLWLAAFGLLGWSAALALCGLGQRWLAGHRPAVRYVADSSYWIYLVHLPLVPPLIGLVSPHMPFPLAWLVVVALMFSSMLALYELLVRHSVVGRVLNGPRPPPRWLLALRKRSPTEPTG